MSIDQLLWPWTEISDNNFTFVNNSRCSSWIHPSYFWLTRPVPNSLGNRVKPWWEIWFRYLVNELISLFIIYLHSYEISFYGFINPIDSLKHLYNSLNYEQQWTQYTTSPNCIQPIKPYLSDLKVNKTHKLETEIYDTNIM